jgi:hypothetical protein
VSGVFYLSRRGVLACGAALGAVGALPTVALAMTRAPVVFFHHDRPMLDPSGLAPPYRPGASTPAPLPSAVFDRHVWL